MEVRQLRQTLVVIQRLGVQQQHVDALSWQLDQVRDQIARSAPESNALSAAVAANEARLAKEQQSGAVRHDIEDEIKKGKAAMEERAVLDECSTRSGVMPLLPQGGIADTNFGRHSPVRCSAPWSAFAGGSVRRVASTPFAAS